MERYSREHIAWTLLFKCMTESAENFRVTQKALNLNWLFKDEKTSTSLQILQSINQIKLSNYDNRFDEFR